MPQFEGMSSIDHVETDDELEAWYREALKRYRTSVRGEAGSLFEIVQRYNDAASALQKSGVDAECRFNFYVFSQLLSKIKAIGFRSNYLKNTYFIEYRMLLAQEVTKHGAEGACAFAFLLSDDFIGNTHKDVLRLLHCWISHYSEIFINLHQYKKATIVQNMGIANTYFEEMRKCCGSRGDKDPVTGVMKYLSGLVLDEGLTPH